MSILPDPDEMLAVAERIAGHADAVRRRAVTMHTTLARVHWHGTAAAAFDLTAAPVVLALHRSAGRLDDAADALRRHAAEVRRNLDAFHRTLSELGGIAGSGLSVAYDALYDPRGLPVDTVSLLDHVQALTGAGSR